LQHERWYGLADKQKEVDRDNDNDNDDDADHGDDDDDSTTIELTFHPFSDDDDDDDDSNLSSSLINIKNGSRDELDSIIQMVDNKRRLPQNNDDDTTKEKEGEQQYQLSSSQHNTTSLQRRCIKALATSKWSGEENDVEMLFRGSGGGGTLTQMTTPIVVEELLIESVIGERQLGTQLTALQAKVQIGNKLRIDENNKTHEQIRALQIDLLNEEQKRYQLAKELEEEAMKREAAERKLVTFDTKVDEEKKKLSSMNAMLEAKLDEEKKRSYSFDLRYRVLELSRRKSENDRQMLELTCIGIVRRLDAMARQEEGLNNACGTCSVLSPFILMLSTMSDRRECEKIKALLQQVVEDQLSQKNKYKSESKKSGTMIALQAKKQ